MMPFGKDKRIGFEQKIQASIYELLMIIKHE